MKKVESYRELLFSGVLSVGTENINFDGRERPQRSFL
jgi:hypothetical protein